MSGLYVLALLAIWVWLTKWLWKGSRRLLASGFANQTVRVALVAAVAVFWLGGTFWEVAGKKMYWDAKVRKLCAIDGGVKVYETVELTPEKFNEWSRNFYRAIHSEDMLGLEYQYKEETVYLRRYNPSLRKNHTQIFRKSDMKLLGEETTYNRGGGDLPGPWQPSSYWCPNVVFSANGGLFNKIFMKQGENL